MSKKLKPPTDAVVIARHLAADPQACRLIATHAVNGLYTDHKGQVIDAFDDFPSGADFIETMVAAFEAAGIGDVVQDLQQKRYPDA